MKNEKIPYFGETCEKHWFLSKLSYSVLQRRELYKIDCDNCIQHSWAICRTRSHSDPIYVTLLRYLIRFLACHQFLKFAMIFLIQFFWRTAKFLLFAMYGVLQASVKYIEGKTWPLYVHVGQVLMHGRRGPTRCNVSRGRSTWCLAQSLPSAWQTFVEFIYPQQFDWFW